MIKPIQSISTINKLSQISRLPTISQIEQLKQITPAYKKQSAIQTALADYNNAMEINSIADAISNADANVARWGETIAKIPFLPTILSAGEHIYKHWLQPVFKSDFKTAGLNILTELSEDTDMFAQPFKALTIGGTKGFKENLEHGGAAGFGGLLGTAVGTIAGIIIGAVTGGAGAAIIPKAAVIGQAAGTMIGSYAQHLFADKDNLKGKTNYDYDTGNLAADMALEIISDPMDWISIATAPVKIGAGIASGVATKSITKTAVNTLEEAGQTVNKSLRKTIKSTVKNIPTAISKSDEAVTNLGQVAKLISDKPFEGETLATLSKLQIDKISSTSQRELLTKTGTILDSLNTLDEIMDGKKYKKPIYDSNGNIKYYVTKKTWGIDPSTRLLKMSLGYTPLGVAIPIIKRVVPAIRATKLNRSIKLGRIVANSSKYFNEQGKLKFNIISDFYKALCEIDAETTIMSGEAVLKNSDESAELLEKMTEESLNEITKNIDKELKDLNKVLNKGKDTITKTAGKPEYELVYQSLNSIFTNLFGKYYSLDTVDSLKQKIYKKILSSQNEIIPEELNKIIKKIENIKIILDTSAKLKNIINIREGLQNFENYYSILKKKDIGSIDKVVFVSYIKQTCESIENTFRKANIKLDLIKNIKTDTKDFLNSFIISKLLSAGIEIPDVFWYGLKNKKLISIDQALKIILYEETNLDNTLKYLVEGPENIFTNVDFNIDDIEYVVEDAAGNQTVHTLERFIQNKKKQPKLLDGIFGKPIKGVNNELFAESKEGIIDKVKRLIKEKLNTKSTTTVEEESFLSTIVNNTLPKFKKQRLEYINQIIKNETGYTLEQVLDITRSYKIQTATRKAYPLELNSLEKQKIYNNFIFEFEKDPINAIKNALKESKNPEDIAILTKVNKFFISLQGKDSKVKNLNKLFEAIQQKPIADFLNDEFITDVYSKIKNTDKFTKEDVYSYFINNFTEHTNIIAPDINYSFKFTDTVTNTIEETLDYINRQYADELQGISLLDLIKSFARGMNVADEDLEDLVDALFDLDKLKEFLENRKLLSVLNKSEELQDILEAITKQPYKKLTNYLNVDYIIKGDDIEKLSKLIVVTRDMSAINDAFLAESETLIKTLLDDNSELTNFVKKVLYVANEEGFITLQNDLKALKSIVEFKHSLFCKINAQYKGDVKNARLIFNAVWSQINNLHRYNIITLSKIINNISDFNFGTNGFFDKIDNFLASNQSVPRFINENLPDLLGLGIKENFVKGFESKLHNAWADTKLSSRIFKAMQNKGLISKNVKPLIYDLETTGVEQSSFIREISIRDINGNSVFHRYIKLTDEQFGLLDTGFKSKFDIKAETADEYNNIYLNYKAKEFGSETKIQDELEALQDFEKFLTQQTQDPNVMLCGHNINKFDNIIIRNRTTSIRSENTKVLSNLSSMFNDESMFMNTRTLDSLELAYTVRGIKQLTDTDKQIILNEIVDYLKTIINISGSNREFLATSPRHVWNSLNTALNTFEMANKNTNLYKNTSDIRSSLSEVLEDIKLRFSSTYNSIDIKGTKTNTGEFSPTVTIFQIPKLDNNQTIVKFRVKGKDGTVYEGRTLPSLLSEINYSASYPIDENVSRFFNIDNLFADIKHGARSNKVLKAPKRYVTKILNYVKSYRYTSFLLQNNLPERFKICLKALQDYGDNLFTVHYFKDLKIDSLTPVEAFATIHWLTSRWFGSIDISKYKGKDNVINYLLTDRFLKDERSITFIKWFTQEYEDIFNAIVNKRYYYATDMQRTFYSTNTDVLTNYAESLEILSDDSMDDLTFLNNLVKLQEQLGMDKLIMQRHARKQALLNKLDKIHKQLLGYVRAIKQSEGKVNPTKTKELFNKVYAFYNENFNKHTNAVVNKILNLDEDNLIMFVYSQQGVLSINKSIDNYDALLSKLKQTGKIELLEYSDRTYAVLNKDIKIKFDKKSKTLTYNKHTVSLSELLRDNTKYTWKVDEAGELGVVFEDYINTLKDLIECDDTEIINLLAGVKTLDTTHKFYEGLPEAVQSQARSLEDMINSSYYDWDSNIIPDYSIIGFNKNAYLNFYDAIRNSVRKVINNEKAHITISELFEAPYYATAWSKSAAEIADDSAYGRIQKLFDSNTLLTFLSEHPEYDLYIRTIDANGKVKVISLPRYAEVINNAYEAGFQIMLETRQVGSLLMDTLNYSNNSAFLTTARSIIKLFKAGFLAFPGTWIRNMLDSYIKNVEDIGSVNATTNTFKAIVMHHEWYKHYNNIIKLGQFNAKSTTWFREATHSYFLTVGATKSKYLNEELFLNIYDFMNEGPSSAILKDLDITNRIKTKYAVSQNIQDELISVPEIKKWYNQNKIKPSNIVDAADDLSNKLLYAAVAPNHYIEQINRLAMFLHYTDEGFISKNKIYDKIAKVHFDFTYKSDFDKYMELVMPFYSFFKENTAFWIEAVENNPAFFRHVINVMQPVANLDEYEHEELERNQSLQNQILTGQIVLDETANLTIKLNPSFLDVLSLFNNPIEALEQRLVDPLKFGINLATQETLINDYGDLLRNLPIVGSVTTRAEMIKRNLERVENNAQLDDTQKLAVKPFAAISSLFGVTQRYNIQKYNNDIYYTQRSSEYYKNSKPKLYNTNEYINYNRQRPIKKLYFPLEAPKGNSNAWYRYLYTKSVQRYLNN